MTTFVYVEMSEFGKFPSGKLHEVDTSLIKIEKDSIFKGLPEVTFDMLMEVMKEHLMEFNETAFIKNWQGIGHNQHIPSRMYALRVIDKYDLFGPLEHLDPNSEEFETLGVAVLHKIIEVVDDLFHGGDTIEVIKIIYAGEVNNLFG